MHVLQEKLYETFICNCFHQKQSCYPEFPALPKYRLSTASPFILYWLWWRWSYRREKYLQRKFYMQVLDFCLYIFVNTFNLFRFSTFVFINLCSLTSKVFYEQGFPHEILLDNCFECTSEDTSSALNNPLLTFTYDNPIDEVLTPNHLLLRYRLYLEPNNNLFEENERFNYKSNVLRHFRKRRSKTCLWELREHHRVKYRISDSKCNVNDITLIYGEHLPWTFYGNGILESFVVSFDDKQELQISDIS